MKKNKQQVLTGNPVPGRLVHNPADELECLVMGGSWMEFEDSFIEILSGKEPESHFIDGPYSCRQIAC